jgi:hypothetical protein
MLQVNHRILALALAILGTAGASTTVAAATWRPAGDMRGPLGPHRDVARVNMIERIEGHYRGSAR